MWVTTESHRDFAERAARDQQPHLALSSSSTLMRDARSKSSGGQTRNGDASHQVLAWIRLGNLYSGFSLVRDPQVFPLRVRDVFGRRGSKGCTRSAAASAVVHSGRSHGQADSGGNCPPTLGNPVLPWASETGPLWSNAKALHSVDDFLIEARAAIKDQVAGRRVVGECLAVSSSSALTRDARSNSSGGQTVTVMQVTKSWHGYDWATYIQAEDENASVSRQQGVVGERNSPRGNRGENERIG
jgi:hypothetical protein